MFDAIIKFLERPYGDDMDWQGWVLFLGFVMVVSLAWRLVLYHILIDIKD